MQQLTIFEYLNQKFLETVTPDDLAFEIGARTGLNFSYDDLVEGYLANKGKIQFYVAIEDFVESGIKYVGIGWNTATTGGSKNCNTIDEAVDFILGVIKSKGKL